jgi:hypothetical protein
MLWTITEKKKPAVAAGFFMPQTKSCVTPVGAGLLAMAPGQATSLLNDEP